MTDSKRHAALVAEHVADERELTMAIQTLRIGQAQAELNRLNTARSEAAQGLFPGSCRGNASPSPPSHPIQETSRKLGIKVSFVKADKDVIALIAYMQRLGRDIAEQPAPRTADGPHRRHPRGQKFRSP